MQSIVDAQRWSGTAQEGWRSDRCGSQCSERRMRSQDCNIVTLVSMQDLFSSWTQGYPTLNKNAGDTKKSLQQFTPSSDRPGRFDTDTSQEFTRVCEDFSWNHHDTALPYRSVTNRTAERACRRVKEGTASVLMQSGLSDGWWVGAVKCDCYLRDRETPYQTRFCAALNGPVVPSGADSSHTSISQKDEQRLHW